MKANNNSTLRYSAYGDPNAKGDPIGWLYFPTFADRFITICLENSYPLWDEALELVIPALAKAGVSIISISKDKQVSLKYGQSVNDITLQHASYLISKSICHVCGCDWSMSLAQHNGHRPLFAQTNSEQVIYNKELFSDGVGDLSRPEIMAKAILERVGISDKIPIETLLMGDSYDVPFVELVPDFELTDLRINNSIDLGVRCDLVENWEFVLALVQRGGQPTIVANNIPPQPILPFIKNIKKLNIWVDQGQVCKDRLKQVEDLGISYDLLSRTEDIDSIKLDLFDFRQIKIIEGPSKEYLDKLNTLDYNTRIKSKRSLRSKDGIFLSVYHWKNGIGVRDPKGALVMDGPRDEDFVRESDLFLYYKMLS